MDLKTFSSLLKTNLTHVSLFAEDGNENLEKNKHDAFASALTAQGSPRSPKARPRFQIPDRVESSSPSEAPKRRCLQAYSPSHLDTSVAFTPVIRYGKPQSKGLGWYFSESGNPRRAPPSPPHPLLLDHLHAQHPLCSSSTPCCLAYGVDRPQTAPTSANPPRPFDRNVNAKTEEWKDAAWDTQQKECLTRGLSERAVFSSPPLQDPLKRAWRGVHGSELPSARGVVARTAEPPRHGTGVAQQTPLLSSSEHVEPYRRGVETIGGAGPSPRQEVSLSESSPNQRPPAAFATTDTTPAAASRLASSTSADWVVLQSFIRSRTHSTALTTLTLTGLTPIEAGQWQWLCWDILPQLQALTTLRLAGMGLEDWHMGELVRSCCRPADAFGTAERPVVTTKTTAAAATMTSSSSSQGPPLLLREETFKAAALLASGSSRSILPRLRILDVGGNALTHHSATHLGELLLWAADTLEELHIASNRLRDHGMQILGVYLSKLCVKCVRAEPYLFPASLVRAVEALWQQEGPSWRERGSLYLVESSESSLWRSDTTARSENGVSDPNDERSWKGPLLQQQHQQQHQRQHPQHAGGRLGAGEAAGSAWFKSLGLGPLVVNAQDCDASVQGISEFLRGASHAHRLQGLHVRNDPARASRVALLSETPVLAHFRGLKVPCALTDVDFSGVGLSPVCSVEGCREVLGGLLLACPRLRRLDLSHTFSKTSRLPPRALQPAMLAGQQARVGDLLCERLAHIAFEAAMGFRPVPLAFSQLRELRLHQTGLTDLGVRALGIARRTTPQSGEYLLQRLSVLDVSGNFLTALGCVQLLWGVLIESHMELTILELQGNAGVSILDTKGLDAVNDAVAAALAHRAQSGGTACETIPSPPPKGFGQAATAAAVAEEDCEGVLPLTIRYGPSGEGAVVYCGQYDMRGGCRTNYPSNSESSDWQGQLTKKKESMPQEPILKTRESSSSFILPQDSARRGEMPRVDITSGVLGPSNHGKREHDTPSSDNIPQTPILSGSGQRRGAEGMQEHREPNPLMASNPQSSITRASCMPQRGLLEDESTALSNPVDSATPVAGLISFSSTGNGSGGVWHSSGGRAQPHQGATIVVEEKAAWEQSRTNRLPPLSNTDLRSCSTVSLLPFSPGGDTGNVVGNDLSSFCQPSETVVKMLRSSDTFSTGCRSHKHLNPNHVITTTNSNAHNNNNNSNVKNNENAASAFPSAWEGPAVNAATFEAHSGDFGPAVGDVMDRVNVPHGAFPLDGVGIQKKLFFTPSGAHDVVNSNNNNNSVGEEDNTSGSSVLRCTVKSEESSEAIKGDRRQGSGELPSSPLRGGVMRCFIISYTHPPGHLLCRVMQVLQQLSPVGEAARLAMEADILRFIQVFGCLFDSKGAKPREESPSSGVASDATTQKTTRKESKQPTGEEVHCIVRDLIEQGRIRLEITSHRRRVVILQLLHQQLSVATLSEQASHFVELMKCLQRCSSSLSTWDMVAFVGSLAVRSRRAAKVLAVDYHGSAVAAVHQTHRPPDRRRLLERLQDEGSGAAAGRAEGEEEAEEEADPLVAPPPPLSRLPSPLFSETPPERRGPSTRTRRDGREWSGSNETGGGGGGRGGNITTIINSDNNDNNPNPNPVVNTTNSAEGAMEEAALRKPEGSKGSRSKSRSAGAGTDSEAVTAARYYRDFSFESVQTEHSAGRFAEEYIPARSPLVVSTLEVGGAAGKDVVSPCALAGGGASVAREGNASAGRVLPGSTPVDSPLIAEEGSHFYSHFHRLGEGEAGGYNKHSAEPSEAPPAQPLQAGERTGDSYGEGSFKEEDGGSPLHALKHNKRGSLQPVYHEKTYVMSSAHTEGGVVCRAWRVLHAGGGRPGPLTEQARAALLEDFLMLLQPPDEDTSHTVSSVNVTFDENGGTTGMLNLQVTTSQRRATIAARLRASVVRGSLECIGTGDAFSSTSSTSDVVALKIAESNQIFFPRLQRFLEQNPFCDTLVLLERSLETPPFQATRRRLLQSYHGLVLLIHYHHGTLSVVLKEFGMKCIDEIAEELSGELTNAPLDKSFKETKVNATIISSSSTTQPSKAPTKQESVGLHSTIENSNMASSLTTIGSVDFKDTTGGLDKPPSITSHLDTGPLMRQCHSGRESSKEGEKETQEGEEEGGDEEEENNNTAAWDGVEAEASLRHRQSPPPPPPSSHSPLAGPLVLTKPVHSRVGSMNPSSSSSKHAETIGTTSRPGITPDGHSSGAAAPPAKNGWDVLLENKHRRLMRVAYGSMAQGYIPLDPQRRQRVRVLRGRYQHQHVVLNVEWEIFFVLYFERSRSLGSTKRTLMLVHPLLCGLTCMLGDDEAAPPPQLPVWDAKQKMGEVSLSKRLVIRIERPYTPDEVGVPEEEMMRELNSNMQQFAAHGKRKKNILNGSDLEGSSIVSGADSNEARDQLAHSFHLSLVIEVDTDSRRGAEAALKILNNSIRRAKEALHESLLAANVVGGPPMSGSDANAAYSRPLATRPTVP